MPNDLLDAARVDGCHTLRVFWHVVLPAVRPAAAVLGLLTFMNTWNDFFWPLIVLSPQNPTVQVAVSTLASGYVEDFALVLTGTFVSILPLLLIFLVPRQANHRRNHARSGEGMTTNGRQNGFVWGAATAAFQIEGATQVDGRGESIWDRFAARRAGSLNGDTGDPACEHYYRWREDLDLMRSLGLQGYRFSIAWPRIQPDGRGPANRKGLDFYRGLVDGLLERGIAPLATLYHWDLPQALRGAGRLGRRATSSTGSSSTPTSSSPRSATVHDWITHNEPW